MNLPLFHFKNASLAFNNKTLFSNINLQICAGDKIALVGKNGSGKSSLIKTMVGECDLDTGERFLKTKKLGYLSQNEVIDPNISIYDYIMQGVEVSEFESREEKIYLADIIIAQLDIDGNSLIGSLSGGKARRASLAKALIQDTDLLFLDEPTNHLDIITIEWLEEYLKAYKGGLVLISHDRAFLNNITNKIFWLDRGSLKTNNQGYNKFEEWSDLSLEQEALDLQKLHKELDKQNHWLTYGVTARRKRNQQRLANLYSLRDKLKNDVGLINTATLNIKLPPVNSAMGSKLVLEMDEVSYSINPKLTILKNFSIRILKGEVIGIIGRNGTGKTSFLKLITGENKASTGKVKLGHTISISYSDQNRESVPKDKTLWQVLCPHGGDTVMVGNEPKHVITYLKDFLFDSKQAHSLVDTLSGGELNRLLLARILLDPGSLLILDEPTNDLDMDSLDMLQEMLSQFQGTILIVSHDRDFLDRLATRVLVFSGDGKIDDYVGGYSDFVATSKNLITNSKNIKKSLSLDKKENKIENSAKKLSYKFERELENLPAEIDQLTSEITSFELRISQNNDLFTENPSEFNNLINSLNSKKELLNKMEERWVELETLKQELN